MSKKIELWDGYEATLDDSLADDADFIQDLSTAIKDNDLATLISMYFALVGGDQTYNDAREYIVEKEGHFSFKAVQEIIKKIDDALPKVGNRASRRSWQTSK
ncbi:MAG: hypothetical protein IKV71_06700 [Psychrobacter sp.]|nr:hypothetical protein [Psychrobacter sp.]